MNKAWTRRAIVIGTVAIVGTTAAVLEGPKLLRKRHTPSPYDDLLDQLDDRDACAQIGEAYLAGKPGFTPGTVAADLRRRLAGTSLENASVEEANRGRVVEANRWLMPESLALMCALAAKAG